MFPPPDVRVAIFSFTISNGQVQDLEIHSRGAQDEVEIAERIQLPEIGTVLSNTIIMVFPQKPWFRKACP